MGETSYLPKNKYRTTLYLDSGTVLRFREKYPVSYLKLLVILLHIIVEGKSLSKLNLEISWKSWGSWSRWL